MEIKENFIHHVYFWMYHPDNREEQNALLTGLQKLSTVPVIQAFHIGIAATTNRDVIETSYSFSWLAVFNSLEDQDMYQTHPIHLEFIKDCSHLWNKVIVYDSIKV